MKYYIIKKGSEVTAIPAEEEELDEYKKRGFKFVKVVAAHDKKDALSRGENTLISTKKWLVLCSVFAVLGLILSIYYLN